MSLIVEDGTGIYNANAYCGQGFVTSYLAQRNRLTEWMAASVAVRDAAIIAATDYIDRRFRDQFRGMKEFVELEVPAKGYLSFLANPTDGQTVTIGSVTYTFRTAAAIANEVTIGATPLETAGALVAALAGTGGGSGTVAHPSASGGLLTGAAVVLVVARTTGPLPAAIQTSSTSANLVWDASELLGGEFLTEQPLQFPRIGCISNNGTEYTGIPEVLKECVAEYASRAISGELMPDPQVDPTGQTVSAVMEKVGPIETETRYVFSSQKLIFQKYPAADLLIQNLLYGSGSVIR